MNRTTWPVLWCGLCVSSAAAQCASPTWSPEFGSAGTGLSNDGRCLMTFDPDGSGPIPEELYVGGTFVSAGNVTGTRAIARWNGVRWASVGGGLIGTSGHVSRLATFDPDGPGPGLPRLVAFGGFSNIGGTPASNIAMWNGIQWEALGAGLPSGTFYPATGVTEYDPDGPGPGLPHLVVCWDAVQQGPQLHEWNGSTWQEVTDTVYQPRSLAVFDEDGAGPANPSLFVATNGGGGLLKLVGNQWQIVGGGLVRSGQYLCNSLAVVDLDGPGPDRPVLLVGGDFLTAGTVSSQAIVAWNGTEWLPMGFPGYTVEGFASVDYTMGSGTPSLYAYAYGAVVRWTPASQTWALMGADPMYIPFPLVRYGLAGYRGSGEAVPSLYLAGAYTDMNGVASNYFARLKCQSCYANCDNSGVQPVLTANDFTCFVGKFAASDPYANCDGSTGTPMLTANDFACFLNQYASGCS